MSTELFLVLISIISIIGFQGISYNAILGIRDSNNSINSKIAISIISGLIPIRVIPIIFGKTNVTAKIINLVCLGFYTYMILK